MFRRTFAATIVAVAVAGGLSLAAGTASAGNVAWSVSVGGPGFAVSAGGPAYGNLGGYYGRPYVPVARPYYPPYYAPAVVYPAPVAYPAPVIYAVPVYAPRRVVFPAPAWRGQYRPAFRHY
jgi:hypothetical protein